MERNNQKNEKFPFSHLLIESLPENLNRIWATVVIDQLIKSGVSQFYLSPGMRNAPLIFALSKAHGVNTIDVIDERAAAYRALGYAKSTGEPVALVCTSGTAMANYLPAILEAKKSSIPLIIISADRPIQLVDHGANQSIEQVNMYSSHIEARMNYPAPNAKDSLYWLASSISHLVQTEFATNRNPIHINLPFYEPLDATKEEISERTQKQFSDLINSHVYFNYIEQEELVPTFKKAFTDYQNILISVGDLNGQKPTASQLAYLKELNCHLCLDVTSSAKYDLNLEDKIIPSFDHPEVFNQFSENPFDLVIHIGGRMTSKHYYRLLANSPNTKVLLIHHERQLLNPSNSRMSQFVGTLAELCNIEIDNYNENAKTINFDFIQKKSDLIDQWSFSFPALSKAVIENAQDNEVIFVANSTLIRSFDLYSSFTVKKNLHIYANRGVSGIEGLLATTLGLSDANMKEVTLVIGDVSLLHDLGSLAMLGQHSTKINIILANNQAGGIFNLLPISEEKEILAHMQTRHEYNFEHLAKQFGLAYSRVHERNEFDTVRSSMRSSSQHQLMEVIIDDEKNRQLYQQLKTVKL